MNRSELGREIAYMQEQTKQIAGLAIRCINDAVAGLVEQDDQKAQAARLAECKTDLIYDEIRERFLVAVARQQPVAGDLRALVTALEIAAEVERIADYGNNIAKLYLKKISREEMRRILQKNGYSSILVWVQTDVTTIKHRMHHKYHTLAAAKTAFDAGYKHIEAPTEVENALVISGKHTFQTQCKNVLTGISERTAANDHQ